MKQTDSAGTHTGQKGRKCKILCLVLVLCPLVITAGLAVIYGLAGTSTVQPWMVYFLFCCLILSPSVVIGTFFDSPIALLAVMTALALLPLAGWFLANAGKEYGFLLIRICMIAEILCWVMTMIAYELVIILAPKVLIAAAAGLMIPLLTLFALRAWQKSCTV